MELALAWVAGLLLLLTTVADVYTTHVGLGNGAKESNKFIVKLFGKYPNIWQLVVIKFIGAPPMLIAVASGGMLGFTIFSFILSGFQGYAAYSNYTKYG